MLMLWNRTTASARASSYYFFILSTVARPGWLTGPLGGSYVIDMGRSLYSLASTARRMTIRSSNPDVCVAVCGHNVAISTSFRVTGGITYWQGLTNLAAIVVFEDVGRRPMVSAEGCAFRLCALFLPKATLPENQLDQRRRHYPSESRLPQLAGAAHQISLSDIRK